MLPLFSGSSSRQGFVRIPVGMSGLVGKSSTMSDEVKVVIAVLAFGFCWGAVFMWAIQRLGRT